MRRLDPTPALRLIAVLLAALVSGQLAPVEAADKAKVGKAPAAFAPDAWLDHVRYLASDELGGRKPGTEGIEKAAEYIAGRFKAAGLEPGGENGTYFQTFDIHDGRRIDEAVVKLEIKGLKGDWKLEKDWTPLPFSKSTPVEGPLAFAGYGIEDPDGGYNDYDGFEPKDKVLMMFRYEPRARDGQPAPSEGEAQKHSWFLTKAQKAAKRGAKAILIVNPPSKPEKDELYAFRRHESGTSHDLPMFHISRSMAEAMLKAGGLPPLKELENGLETERKSASADLAGLSASLDPGLVANKIETRNVIGVLRGESKPDEYVVLGAHYDHLGTSPRSFQNVDATPRIHNGADDNASGTAGIIELARVFGSAPRPRRSVVFMTYSAEEMGLLGSAHFVSKPTIDLKAVKAMINLDMIGRFGQDRLEIFGADTGKGLDELVRSTCAELGIRYSAPPRNTGVFDRSDHASFYRHDIPVLFPFTGLHKQYHQPEDDWELTDPAGAARVLELTYTLARSIAEMKSGPEFVPPQSEKRPADLASRDEPKPAAPKDGAASDKMESQASTARSAVASKDEVGSPHAATDKSTGQPAASDATKTGVQALKPTPHQQPADPQRSGPRTAPGVRMGLSPGYSDDGKPGMRVEAVSDGGPAEKAGIQANDRIVRIGEKEVSDIHSYMDALASLNPGDTVEVKVLRSGKEQTLKVKLIAGGRRDTRE